MLLVVVSGCDGITILRPPPELPGLLGFGLAPEAEELAQGELREIGESGSADGFLLIGSGGGGDRGLRRFGGGLEGFTPSDEVETGVSIEKGKAELGKRPLRPERLPRPLLSPQGQLYSEPKNSSKTSNLTGPPTAPGSTLHMSSTEPGGVTAEAMAGLDTMGSVAPGPDEPDVGSALMLFNEFTII